MGSVITFYSFKGGTGRTFALVNTGCLLAQSGKKVLLIDWDLDAPGLDNYLEPYLSDWAKQDDGLIELMYEFKRRLSNKKFNPNDLTELSALMEELMNQYVQIVNLPDKTTVHYLKAGLFNENYSKKVQLFKWRGFFNKFPLFFTHFAFFLNNKYDFTLIDARTGHTDVGGICTMLMPEKLVLVHTMNNQSIDGVIDIARKAVTYRGNSTDLRPLVVFPLPSRVDLQEEVLHNDWKNRCKLRFKNLLIDCYSLPKTITVDKYFDLVQIRHTSFYSYGEKVAVLDFSDNNRYSLNQAFKSFLIQMNDIGQIWEYDPFSNLKEPLKANIVYSIKDSNEMKQFMKQINPLVSMKVLDFDENIFPVEKWDNQQIRAFSVGKYNIIIILLSESLISEPVLEKYLNDIRESDRETVFSIFLSQDIKIPHFFQFTYKLPRIKILTLDPVDIWAQIGREFKNILINITNK